MELLISLTLIAFCVYYVVTTIKNTNSEPSHTTCSADINGVMRFLHGYHALCSNHSVVSSNVLIQFVAYDNGESYEIRSRTTIFKIDGLDAAYSVALLRTSIHSAKSNILNQHRGADSLTLYKLQSAAKDKIILDFFGVESLQGAFWDIEDCEYIDGKYIEFDDLSGGVFTIHKQSVERTIETICANTTEIYPNAKITKTGNNQILISFA